MKGKEERKVRVIFGKSGSGSETAKICLPVFFLQHMNISKDNREVTMTMDYDSNIIFIKK